MSTNVPVRSSVRLVAVVAGLVSLAALAFGLWTGRQSQSAPPAQATIAQGGETPASNSTGHETSEKQAVNAGVGAPEGGGTTETAPPAAPPPPLAPTPATRQLVLSLVNLQPEKGALTLERAGEWKQNLQELIQLVAAAAPAIRDFLSDNTDYDFGPAGSQMLGYS